MISSRARPALFARIISGAILFGITVAVPWLAAQPEPAKKVREEDEEPVKKGVPKVPRVEEEEPGKKELPKVPRVEEEEDAKTARPKVPIVVDDEPKGKKAAPRPAAPAEGPGGVVNLRMEALKAKQPQVRDYYKSIAIPYDVLETGTGYQYRIGLLAEKELVTEDLEYIELNSTLTAGTKKKISVGQIKRLLSYEEEVLRITKLFLAAKKIENLTRPEQLEIASKGLIATIRFHTAAVEQNKRVGKAWKDILSNLRSKLLEIQREQLKVLQDLKQWEQAENFALYLSSVYPDDAEVTKDVYRLQLIRADQALGDGTDNQLLQLRDALMQYERQLGGAQDALVTAIRKKLRARADDHVRKAKEFTAQNQTANALGILRAAELLDPEVGGVKDVRTKLRERVLYVAVRSLPERMSPVTARSDSELWAVELMFESLLQSFPDPELGRVYRPQLAEGMPDMSPLGREFQLRRDVRWGGIAAGETLDARDVRGTLAMLLEPKFAHTPAADGFDLIRKDSVRIEDPFRLRLPFSQGVLEPLSRLTFKVLPTEYLRRNRREPDDEEFARNPFGTGPYRYDGQEREGAERQVAVFRANPYYGQRPGGIGLPLIREIRFNVQNKSNAIADIQAGQLHLLPDVSTAEFIRFRDDSSVNNLVRTFTAQSSRRIHMLAINHRKPALQNPETRRGLSLAIDRESILKDVFRVEGTNFHRALTGPFPPQTWATPAKAGDLYKPDLARVVFTEAGKNGGLRFTLKYADDDKQAGLACERMKDQIEKAGGGGVTIALEPLPSNELRRKVEQEQDFDLAYVPFDYRDDLFRLDGLLDPTAGARNGRNFLGYMTERTSPTERDRRLQQTILEIRGHRDFCRQVKEKTWELHQLFNQQVPFVPLWHLDRHIVLSNNVDVMFEDSIRPVQASQLDPTRLFTCIERWRLK